MGTSRFSFYYFYYTIYIVSGYNFDLTYPIRVQFHFLILVCVVTAFHSRIGREQVLPRNFQ